MTTFWVASCIRPDEGSLLPKYGDCTTPNCFELCLLCCGVMLVLLIIYICLNELISHYFTACSMSTISFIFILLEIYKSYMCHIDEQIFLIIVRYIGAIIWMYVGNDLLYLKKI